jgi:serine protease AprX
MKKHFLFSRIEWRGVFKIMPSLFAVFSTSVFALQVSTGPNGSNVQDVHSLGYTGQGVAVGLISANHALDSHEAFASQAFLYDATDTNPYDPVNHDTSVGGIICSRGGASFPNEKGCAPDASLYSVKTVNGSIIEFSWLADSLAYLLGQQCQVVVTGIQLPSSGATPDGTTFWSLLYDHYAWKHNFVFATAAGNGESVITVFGDTFNSITTGGLIIDANDIYYQVGSTSNPGPTADGRKKPDIVAPSEGQWTPKAGSNTSWADAIPGSGGQTSWSVPHTGGVAAVLLSYADTTPTTDDNQNEVIKAVIVNSAFPNIINKAGTATTGLTWQADRGYGRIDAKRAYEILSSPEFTPGSSTGNSKGWAYGSLAPDGQNSYVIDRTEGLEKERLLVTLTWNRRVEWTDQRSGTPPRTNGIIDPDELEAFFANLDLEIYDPDGILISPAASSVDNLEKVDLLLSKTGDYEVKVVNQSSNESASYGLAFEVLPRLEGDFNFDYVVETADLALLAQHWLDTGCIDPVPCYEYDLSGNNSIELSDFSIFAQNWLAYDGRYYSP